MNTTPQDETVTEFEKQVEEALWEALGSSPIPPQSPPSYVGAVRALAPRVAAAIEEASEASDMEGGREVPKGADHWRARALAALRGELP